MNTFKRFIIILLILTLSLSCPTRSIAYTARKHNKQLEDVLFGDLKIVKNNPNIDALESAAYLAIDQFNSDGANDLEALKAYGVKNLPASIEDFKYPASGTTHRTYTHRGWDFQYTGEMATKWPIRQEILLNTADAIFDFRGNIKQEEAFCKLIYYTHLIGDHLADESYLTQNGLKMDLGGRHDNISIIQELINLTPELFPNQKNTHRYSGLISSLRRYDTQLSELVNSEGGINTDDKFSKKKVIAEDLISIMRLYYSKMLQKEQFFSEVFYN